MKDWKSNRWIAVHSYTRAQDNESQSWCIPILLMSPLRNVFLGEPSHKYKALLQQTDFLPLWQPAAASDLWLPLVGDFSFIHSFTCQHSVCAVCSQLLSGLGSLEKCGRSAAANAADISRSYSKHSKLSPQPRCDQREQLISKYSHGLKSQFK